MSRRRTAIVTDSTADLPPDLVRERAITVVPLTVTVNGRSHLDGVEITPEQLYAALAAPAARATTSQPSPAHFEAAYRRLLADHDEVLSLHLSSQLSGTCAAAVQGAVAAGPERVRVIDTEQVSLALGLCVLAAAAMAAADETATATGIAERLRPLQESMRVFFVVATLEHLRRGGRIGRAAALLGSVLQVKPVLTLQDGQVAPLERVRTQERALARIIELAAGQPHPLCAMVGHAGDEERALRIAGRLEPIAETLIVAPLGPVVGAHAGPGTVGVGCYPAELFPLGLRRLRSLAAS